MNYKKILSSFLVFLLVLPSFVFANNQTTNYANPHAVTNIQPTNSIYEGTENFSDWDNAVRYVNGGSVITTSTDTAHTGTISLKAEGSLYNGARLIKTNLTVGQTVTFTGYLKATADNGNPFYIRTNGTEQNDWNQIQLLPNGDWQQFTITGVINYTSVDFNVFQINSTTPFYLDDVKIFYGQPSDNPTTKTFTYDHNGNLISDGTWTHSWDYNNRLISSTNGTKTIAYAYDSTGNRVSKSDGAKTTYYVNQYYEIENGNVKKHIFAGSNKIATIENNNTYYHHTDHLTGSNIDTDSTGNVLEAIDYFPFGSVRVDLKTGDYSNDYKFTGKELDQDTSLYYYGARYYDGGIGRFTSIDPMVLNIAFNTEKYGKKLNELLSNPQELNSYSYVTNNPLKYVDPTGESTVSAWLLSPMKTVAQTAFWQGVSNGYLRDQKGWNISAGFLEHSLALNPKDLNITQNNDKYGVIEAIKKSEKYQEVVTKIIDKAVHDNKNFVNSGSQLISFDKKDDLFGSLHDATINIQGSKQKDGSWSLNVSMHDVYDFKYGNEYSNKSAQTGANIATYSQSTGTISNYDIKIKFKDKKE